MTPWGNRVSPCDTCIHADYCMERRGGCRDYQKKKTLEEIRKDIERLNERYRKDQKEAPPD